MWVRVALSAQAGFGTCRRRDYNRTQAGYSGGYSATLARAFPSPAPAPFPDSLAPPCPSASGARAHASLVVEEPQAGERHRHVVLVCGGDDLGISHGAAGRHEVRDALGGGDVDRVAEGEEGVGGE